MKYNLDLLIINNNYNTKVFLIKKETKDWELFIKLRIKGKIIALRLLF